MPYAKILAAVDLSEESAQVLKQAKALADQHGASLSLITVIKPLTNVYVGLNMAPLSEGAMSFEQQALDQARQQLRDTADEYGLEPANAIVAVGPPAGEIRAHAEAIGADLIVIGTHGRHGLNQLLLGSTANAVLHGVECDMLVIRVRDPK